LYIYIIVYYSYSILLELTLYSYITTVDGVFRFTSDCSVMKFFNDSGVILKIASFTSSFEQKLVLTLVTPADMYIDVL
jgi:hypothetical protein